MSRRQEDELKKVRKRERSALHRHRTRTKFRTGRQTVTLHLPTVFSLIKNPDGVVSFLRELEAKSWKRQIDLDLAQITTITPEAIAALLANVRRISPTPVRGNLPTDIGCQEILLQSGFFTYVSRRPGLKISDHGKIGPKRSRKVDGVVAMELIHHGNKAIYGEPRRCQPAYRVLIEGMNNTREHAAREGDEKETWWSTVYPDLQRKCVCYTFLDTGVGIFKSVKISAVKRAYRKVGLLNNADILLDILKGNVESSTGLSYRGKGLPAIYQHFLNGRIRSLVIIANRVFADVAAGNFRMMDIDFHGTLLYWEV